MGKKPTAVPAKPEAPAPQKSTKPTGRVEFSKVGNKDPEVYPFKDAIPEGFDFKAHKALKKRDFSADHLFYEFRAAECEAKAVAFRIIAEECKKLGSAKDRGKAKRLIKLREKMEELKAQLTEQGIDVDELLKDSEEE